MINIKPRVIIGNSSIFLDALRIGAALTVLYIHAFDMWFPKLAHPQYEPGEPSHAAVVIFFVLSGYVIAHTTISRNRGAILYAQARLSRLCSIVIPALVITAIMAVIVKEVNPALFATYSRGHEWVRYLVSGLFMNELWFFSGAPPINISLWSLSFEFWYYAIFGLWFFRKGGLKTLLLPVAAVLIAGPKILAMMPVWLLGYAAYIIPRPTLKVAIAWCLVFIGCFSAWLAVVYVPFIPYKIGYKPLFYANQFVTDWIVGLFIGAALWILPTGNQLIADFKFATVFRKAADLTFPLYVLHFPLLVLWRALFGYKSYDLVQLSLVLITVLIMASLLGWVMEMQRHIWTRFFKRLLVIKKEPEAAEVAFYNAHEKL
ncbi:acyltransferase family protein [Mucilaginibacter psychrotolerans]|uniref:Acyltransferase n=1 Tax=Mucilaginibacter psychrotolerans TaxID=1524096 RepID=A0A4Y8SJG8_9SPHI|nr:acyltransferase [Mucilaginibacter psychrotolerans]TFF38815.1 acyltransferase [Mucilaginibacter psychrotolerans]